MVKPVVLHSSLVWLELPLQQAVCFPSEQLSKAWLYTSDKLGECCRLDILPFALSTKGLTFPQGLLPFFRIPKPEARKQPQGVLQDYFVSSSLLSRIPAGSRRRADCTGSLAVSSSSTTHKQDRPHSQSRATSLQTLVFQPQRACMVPDWLQHLQ